MSCKQTHIGEFVASGQIHIQTGPFGTQLGASDYTSEGTPVINVRNIGYGNLRPDKLEYIPDSVVKRLKKHVLEQNDIVFGRKGAVDRHLLVSDEQAGWVQGSDCIRLRVLSGSIDPIFLSFVLRLDNHKQWMLSQCSNKATMASLNQGVINRIPICVPDRATQKSIVFILKSYDDLIENNRRRIQLLEQSARLLYKEWFVHLRFPGHEHTLIINGVPESWEKKHLSQIFNTQYGFTESATNDPVGPKFLRGTDINKTSYIDWSAVPYCPDEKLDFQKYKLQIDDILVIRMADPGKVAIVETEEKAVFASYLIRLTRKPGIEIPALYLFYVLASDQYQGFISGASGGSTRKSANAKLVVDFVTLIPTASLSQLFTTKIQPMRQQIQTLLQQNANLRKARDLLLPKLMNGEMAV